MSENFDDEVELAQVLALLGDLQADQVVIGQLPRGRGLLHALGHQAHVLVLVKHVHQHLHTHTQTHTQRHTHTQVQVSDYPNFL